LGVHSTPSAIKVAGWGRGRANLFSIDEKIGNFLCLRQLTAYR
jgi:hypothetical protein